MDPIRIFTPEVFNSPSIKKHGVVYAETRRDPSAPLEELSGSMSVQEYSGQIPLVLSQKNYERTSTSLSFEEWTDAIEKRVRLYDEALKRELGLRAIGYINVTHGTDLISLDDMVDQTDINVPFANRPKVDAAMLTQRGIATVIAPADCVVANIVDTNTGALLQVHAGYAGMEKEILAHALTSTKEIIDPKRSVAYLSPHAQEGYVINQQNNILVDRFKANPHLRPFLLYKENGEVELSLGEAFKAQLNEAGIPEANVEISPDNTLTDPTLYSQSTFLTRDTNGRNGMLFGKRP
jgi:copper oxidase (laccase) domain-containing protein